MEVIPPEEKHKQGGRIDSVRKITLIEIQVLIGDGTESWPYRHVYEYRTENGTFVMRRDDSIVRAAGVGLLGGIKW